MKYKDHIYDEDFKKLHIKLEEVEPIDVLRILKRLGCSPQPDHPIKTDTSNEVLLKELELKEKWSVH